MIKKTIIGRAVVAAAAHRARRGWPGRAAQSTDRRQGHEG